MDPDVAAQPSGEEEQSDDDEKGVCEFLNEEQIIAYREAFGLFDPKGTKTVQTKDLITLLKACCHFVSEEETEMIIKKLDPDVKGVISRKSFMEMMSKRMEYIDEGDEIRDMFRVFDVEGVGFVSAYDLKKYMMTLGDKMTEEEAEEFIKEADINRTASISYDDFVIEMETEFKKKLE